jgi:hypothetical protein
MEDFGAFLKISRFFKSFQETFKSFLNFVKLSEVLLLEFCKSFCNFVKASRTFLKFPEPANANATDLYFMDKSTRKAL